METSCEQYKPLSHIPVYPRLLPTHGRAERIPNSSSAPVFPLQFPARNSLLAPLHFQHKTQQKHIPRASLSAIRQDWPTRPHGSGIAEPRRAGTCSVMGGPLPAKTARPCSGEARLGRSSPYGDRDPGLHLQAAKNMPRKDPDGQSWVNGVTGATWGPGLRQP